MTTAVHVQSRSASRTDTIQAELIEQYLERLHAGEALDPSEFAARYPEHAEALRQLLPALQMMAELSRSAARDRSGLQPSEALTGPELGVVGDFRILREVGRGGMGVVYEAEQLSLHRRVALKVLPLAGGLDPRQLQRFKTEAQAAALLHHTNIVPIHAVGCERGVHYYSMQFIEGRTLADIIRELRQLEAKAALPENPLPPRGGKVAEGRMRVSSVRCSSPDQVHNPIKCSSPDSVGREFPEPVRGRNESLPAQGSEGPTAGHPDPDTRPAASQHATPMPATSSTRDRAYFRNVARLGVEAAEALEHAHQEGVIHRDIKPANLLVDTKGKLWITDFGLARLQADTGITITGDLLGTLRYMSPEQALAQRGYLDHRTDIYSLGATLYELMTLRPPIDGQDRQEVLRKIAHDEPAPPRQLNPAIARELETILLKAMSKEPQSRYATAQELGDDLQRFLEHKPIKARRPTLAERSTKWARRHATTVSSAALVLLFAVAGLATSNRIIERRNAEITRKSEEVVRQQAQIKSALKESEQAREQAEAVSAFLVAAFRKPDPAEDGGSVKAVDVLDQAAAKLDAEFAGSPQIHGSLLHVLGDTFLGLGLPARAIKLFTKARSVREAAIGPDDPDTLTTCHSLAEAYSAAGRTADAIAMHEQTLKRREAKLGAHHPDTLESRDSVAVVYGEAGRTAEAIALHEETAALMDAKLGPDHPATVLCRNNLADAYAAAGRTAEAIPLYEETGKQMEAKLGLDHPNTLIGRDNLAYAYAAAGRIAEAISLHEETGELMEAKLGLDHPGTLASHSKLAGAYMDAGRIADAIALYEETGKLYESKLGPDHPDTLRCRDHLGFAYLAVGRITDAIALHERTGKLMEARLGPHHPDTLINRKNLAEAYLAAQRIAQAITMHQATLELMDAELGTEHPATMATRRNLAQAYMAAGRLDRSTPLHEMALKQFSANLGPDHPKTLITQASLGVNYREAGRPNEGARLMEDALRRAAGRVDAMVALESFPAELSRTYMAGAQYLKAEAVLVDNLERARATFGVEDLRTTVVLDALGGNLLQQNKFAEAEPVLRQCLAIRGRAQAEQWPMFSSESMLGEAMLGQKKFAEAEPLVVRGYEGLTARADIIPFTQRSNLAAAAERVVRLYEALKQPGKAVALLRKEDWGALMPNGAAAFACSSDKQQEGVSR
jgi:serine/threonine protein kinase/tetratricopeptide (TPR) repeat protein